MTQTRDDGRRQSPNTHKAWQALLRGRFSNPVEAPSKAAGAESNLSSGSIDSPTLPRSGNTSSVDHQTTSLDAKEEGCSHQNGSTGSKAIASSATNQASGMKESNSGRSSQNLRMAWPEGDAKSQRPTLPSDAKLGFRIQDAVAKRFSSELFRRRRVRSARLPTDPSEVAPKDVGKIDEKNPGQTGPAEKFQTVTTIQPILAHSDLGVLPDTPTSMGKTPTQMYSGLPDIEKERKVDGLPLREKPVETQWANGSLVDQVEKGIASPTSLTVIPELSPLEKSVDKALEKPRSLVLRSGSVITLFTPEQMAWQRTLYVQGPIRLERRFAEPRKDSVASLDAFQDAVEELEAVQSSRRASDDAVVDGIVDFFESFAFDDALMA